MQRREVKEILIEINAKNIMEIKRGLHKILWIRVGLKDVYAEYVETMGKLTRDTKARYDKRFSRCVMLN